MNKPKIRFKGFEGEWKRQSLGDISASFSGGTPAVSVSDYYGGNIPFIRSGEIHENRTQLYITQAGLNNSSAKIVEKGTILYALYGGATSGDVGFSKLRGAINQAILAIEPTKKYIDRIFLVGFLQSYKHRIINELLQGGQGNLSGSLVKKILLAFPSLPEQRALASYFTSLDAQIAASTSRLSSLKQIKAASLLNMFPQKGETVPRVRFKGFQGEWKEMQFGVAFEYQRNNSLSRAELSDEGIVANIHYGDVLIKYGDCLDVSKDVLTYVKDKKIGMALYKKGALRNGDVIFADAAEDNTVGKCTEVICEENVCIVSGLHTIACRPQVEVVERYLGCSLNSPSFHNQLLPHIQGTKISSISKNALSSTSIFLPSLPEQRAIASYFTALDAQITLHRERLEKLKQIKAACLEKMFA